MYTHILCVCLYIYIYVWAIINGLGASKRQISRLVSTYGRSVTLLQR